MKWTFIWLQYAVLCVLQRSGSAQNCECPYCDFRNARNDSFHLINVIFNKPGKSSSLYRNTIGTCGAVNGYRAHTFYSTRYPKPNCVHTAFNSKPYKHWLEYDLRGDYTIDRVEITRRVIRVHRLMCIEPVTGRYLRIYKRNEYTGYGSQAYYIQLCEVSIWICDEGYYGNPSDGCKACPSPDQCHYDICNNYYGCERAVLRNLAALKSAKQSSVQDGAPSKAVDNNMVGERGDECTSTDPAQDGESNRWWRVDLGSLARIFSVNITNRLDCCGQQLNNFKVLVSDTAKDISSIIPEGDICHAFTGLQPFITGEKRNFECSQPMLGRYVAVVVESPDILHFCEVQAYGYLVRGEPCNPQSPATYCAIGSTCISLICKISPGASCVSAGPEHCVQGTSCVHDICALNLNGVCENNRDHCRFDMSCDESLGFRCRLNLGEHCNQTEDCVSGAICDLLKQCKLQIDSSCQDREDKCPYRSVCEQASDFTCKWDMGQTCEMSSSCVSGTTCDYFKKCKKPIGQACISPTECIAGTSCVNSKCFCSGTTATATCDAQEGRAGGPCSIAKGTVCVENSVCIDDVCTCGQNYGVYTLNYTCRISVPGVQCQASYDCNTGLVCDQRVCKMDTGHACDKTSDCKNQELCSGGICKIAIGQSCTQTPALCEIGSACGNGICKLQLNQPCNQNNSQCIQGTICSKSVIETIATCTYASFCSNLTELEPGSRCLGHNKTFCASMAQCDVDNVCKLQLFENCDGPYQKFCKIGTTCSNQKCRLLLRGKCDRDEDCLLDAVCDNYLTHCRLQVGAKCADPALKEMCTSGASCSDQSICACTNNGSNAAAGKCVPTDRKVTGSCVISESSNHDDSSDDMDSDDHMDSDNSVDSNITMNTNDSHACDDPSALCVRDPETDSATCECSSGYAIFLKNFTCGVNVGQACMNSSIPCIAGSSCSFSGYCDLEVGQSCEDEKVRWCKKGSVCENGVCRANLREDCSGINKDLCTSGTVCDILSKCKFPVNATCSSIPDVCVAGAACVNSTCQCSNAITAPQGSICEAVMGLVTGPCKSSACNDPNANCFDEKICVCKAGFTVQASDLSCKTDVNGPCSKTAPSCTTGTTCDSTSKTCSLQLGQYCGAGNEEFCISGAICDIDQRCKLVFGERCTGSNIMHCRTGIFCDWFETCKLGISRNCSTDNDCVMGAVCVKSACTCLSTDSFSTGAICAPRFGYVGGYCNDIIKCKAKDSSCVNGLCKCLYSRRAEKGFQCEAAVGKNVSTDVLMAVGVFTAISLVICFAYSITRHRHKMRELKKVRHEMAIRLSKTKQLALELDRKVPPGQQMASIDTSVVSEGVPEVSEVDAPPLKPLQSITTVPAIGSQVDLHSEQSTLKNFGNNVDISSAVSDSNKLDMSSVVSESKHKLDMSSAVSESKHKLDMSSAVSGSKHKLDMSSAVSGSSIKLDLTPVPTGASIPVAGSSNLQDDGDRSRKTRPGKGKAKK